MLFLLMAYVVVFVASPVMADGFVPSFGLSKIDYFNIASGSVAQKEGFSSDQLWSEVRFSPEGEIQIFRPPLPVLEFLEAPSVETGRRYLEWNTLRLGKIEKAQGILERLQD